jgi:transposase
MNDMSSARATDAATGRLDIKRKALSAEGKLRVAIEAMAPGADLEALARRHRVDAEEIARWRAFAGDAALLALKMEGGNGIDLRAQLANAEMRDMQREVRRHRLANAMLSEGLATAKENFRKFTGVDPDDDIGMAELERAHAERTRVNDAA